MPLNDIYGSTDSKWLKAADLQGQKPVVTIESAQIVENEYEGVKKSQIVLKFVGKEKQLGLNFTNASRIADLTDTAHLDTAEMLNAWVGLTIKLYQDTTKMQDGRTVPCIRIFPELPEQGRSAAAANASTQAQRTAGNAEPPTFTGTPTDDDIPF